MTQPPPPSDSVLQRIEGFARTQHDSGYERGYVDGYVKTRKMLARRSLAFLLVGLMLGGTIVGLISMNGILGERPAPAPDPATMGVGRGDRYKAAADFAKQFTVGVIAEESRRGVGFRHNYVEVAEHLGSGFVFDDKGYIVTNAHVVRNAQRFRVVWQDRVYNARLVGTADEVDVAVLRVNAADVKGGTMLNDKEQVFQSEEVLAIGSPHGLHYTVTAGIVSYVGRVVGDEGARFAIPYIQTDAAINRGNSGGPLVNLQGRIVGMNTWIISESGDASGLGFAIPVSLVRQAALRIIEEYGTENAALEKDAGEPLERAFLGIEATSLEGGGVELSKILPYSPAANIGLQPGDIVEKADGKRINTSDDLVRIVHNHKPGDVMRLDIIRSGRPQTINVNLGARPK